MKGRISVLVAFFVLLICSTGFSEVRDLDLSQASGNSSALYRSSLGRWELGKSGWVQIVESQTDINSGTFNGTKLNSEGKIVLNLPTHCSVNFISKVHNLSETAGEETITYNLYVPTGASGAIYLRHGSTPSSMGEWLLIPSTGYSIRNLIGSNNYIQYKVEMGSNTSCTSSPSFGGITLLWLRFTTESGRVGTAKVADMRASLVKGVSVVKNEPSGTEIRWAVSDDNGTTYKKYQNGSWVKITSISTDGNTTGEFQSIPQSAWGSLSSGYFKVFFSLRTNVNYLSPSVSSIQVNYDLPAIEVSSFSCSPKLYVGEKGSCQVASQTNIGRASYQWSGPSDMQITPEGASARVSFSASGRKALKLKALIEEIPDTFTEKSLTIDVATPQKPRVILSGPKGVMFGEGATYQAEVSCPERMACSFRFLVDGKTYGDQTIEVLFEELGKHSVVAQAWDPNIPNSLGESSISVFVSQVPKPLVSIISPKKVELGVPFTLSAKISASYGTPSGYFVLPDDSHVSGDTLTYTATKRVDDLKFKYVAYIEGFDYTATTVESSPIKVDVYEMLQFKIKSFQKLDKPIYAPYGAFFGVTGNVGMAKDFGVTLTHRWDFGDGTVIEGGEPGRTGHSYTEAGTYTVTLSVFDDRGNVSTDSLEITILSPPSLVVGPFKIVSSNKYNRAPLKVFLRPNVMGGHPTLDKVSSYNWTLNGDLCSEARMFSATLNDPGDYVIGLRVETNTGKVAEGTQTITVNPNQLPECTISYQDYPKYKYTKIISSCKDPDGKVKSYYWDLGDGTTSDKSKVFAKYQESGTYLVSLTVTDDSGDQAVFSLPVTVER